MGPIGHLVSDKGDMAGEDSRIEATIDLWAEGKHQGFLVVPHSRDESAWGAVPIPITSVANGDGPSVLFTGGLHGDEYEGPIALMELARELVPEAVCGRVVIVPALNLPAVKAGTRLSPIDRLNMNRIFPGRRNGTLSEMIAHFVYHRLVAQADVVVDLHSGGKTLDFVPSVVMHDLPDPVQMAHTRDLLLAFGAPLAMILTELDSEGMIDTVVEQAGKIFLSTELGGGGSTTPERVRIARRGLTNVLRHLGVIEGVPELGPDGPSRPMHTPASACFTMAADAGLYEPLVALGAEVSAGAVLGRVHFFEDVDRAPALYRARRSGTLYARHYLGLVQRGDCLAVVACDLDHGGRFGSIGATSA